MKGLFAEVALFVLAGCAAPTPHPEPVALEAKAQLPPHVIEAVPGWGWYSCAPGYVLRRGACLAESEIPAGPEIIASLEYGAGVLGTEAVGGHA